MIKWTWINDYNISIHLTKLHESLITNSIWINIFVHGGRFIETISNAAIRLRRHIT